ncbi:PQQ-binding-like beta-propeller repeat protein [Isoptericola jiangsuensis]|uniref:outer membrane protein assembly factor BamB family protein n=1 Tax=Isoptericola jiangsuensis TaxID=548579 RepID=UPI003AAE28D4
MARRRDSRLIIEIDTGPDVEDVTAHDGGTGAAGEPPRRSRFRSWSTAHVTGPVRARWAAVPRRTRIGVVAATATVAVAVTGAAVVLDHRADAAHAARMAALPGGVVDLSVPLVQTWQVESDGGVLAELDGGLLVLRDGSEVLAVDAVTGQEAWRHDLGRDLQCGSAYDGWTYGSDLEPQDSVVCLVGSPQRTAVVVAADGEILGRRVLGEVGNATAGDQRDGEVALVMREGAVAVGDVVDIEVTGDDPADVLAELDARRAAGEWHDPALRVEDALTGEVRGRGELTVDSAVVLDCLGDTGTGGGSSWVGTGPYAQADGMSTFLAVCSTVLSIAADGTVTEGTWSRERESDGLRFAYTEDGTTVEGPDGSRFSVPGYVMEVSTTDDVDAPLLAVVADGMAAYDRDGTRRWHTEGEPRMTRAFLQAAGTFVVAQDDGGPLALDVETGEVLWRSEERLGPGSGGHLVSGLTDGRVGLLVTSGVESGAELFALDLGDGATRWSMELTDPLAQVMAVDGHVVIAETGDGETYDARTGAPTTDSTVRGYATP